MQNSVAVVTGASSGFGLLAAVALAREGYQVVAAMRSPGSSGRLQEAAAQAGVADRIDVHLLDVTNADHVAETAEYVDAKYGRCDVLLNNAGFALAGFVEDVSLEELRRQLETNLFGHVAVTKAFLPLMRRHRSGVILMMSSISGRAAFPGVGSYACSKFALEGWTEALRLELRSTGIRVVLIEPGAFQTDIWTRNSVLSERSRDAGSPNVQRTKRFGETIRKQGEKARPDPKPVVDAIVKIARSSNPRLRHVIGNDARMMVRLQRLLPAGVLEKLLIRIAGIDG